MRATRGLWRRRPPLMRNRAARLAHVHNPNSPANRPAIGQNIADKAHREGVAARFRDPAVQKTIEVDLALITYDDALLRDLELAIVKTAKQHDAHTLYWRQTVPGIGTILSLVLRYAIQDIGRFPRVQDFASYARLVKCRQESAGNRLGPSGQDIGNAHRKWAFSEAATLCLCHNPHGQQLLTRWERQHGQGNALTILAHKLARAVYDMLTRNTACDMASFRRAYRSSAGEPAVSLDTYGMRRPPARCLSCLAASWHAQACLGLVSQSPGG
jgi:transposase